MDGTIREISVDEKCYVIVDKRGYVPFTMMPLYPRVHLVPSFEDVAQFVRNQTGCEVKFEEGLGDFIDTKKIMVYKKGSGIPPIEYGFCQPAQQFLQWAKEDTMKPTFSLRVIDDFEGDVMNEIPIKDH